MIRKSKMKIVSYKDRQVDCQKQVDVYRCLTRKGKIYSIRQNGIVVGHSEHIILKDCKFIVNEAGKEKAIETHTRNVHAYIKGTLANNIKIKDILSLVVYNPFVERKFTSGKNEVNSSELVIINKEGVMAKL